ncbi:Putative ribonuclease H protein At1g65750 [Linum perenne]
MRVVSTSPIDGWDMRVSALILPEGTNWDESRVRTLFIPEEANIIMSMPLAGGRVDKRIWHYSRNSDYTVRSAYRLLREVVVPTGELQVQGDWTRLWRSRVPQKMKHMVWRTMRGVLPTKETLQRRGIAVDWDCGVCKGNPETPRHLFLDCEFAMDCWAAAGIQTEVLQWRDNSEAFTEWMETVLKEGDDRSVHKVVSVLWAIWKERNERLWSQKASEVTTRRAEEAVIEWQLAQDPPTTAGTTRYRSAIGGIQQGSQTSSVM